MGVVRILFLADTHLGFDYPFNPRIKRRRRGDDFFLNFSRALEPARSGTFRNGEDVIKTSDIPAEFQAVLSGHIHRFQVLTSSLNGLDLKAPIFYPGSIDRTSFAEKDEPKGYLILEITPDSKGSILSKWQFHELPTRPMIKVPIDITGLDPHQLRNRLKISLGRIDPNSIVRIEIQGKYEEKCFQVLRAAEIRTICPREMNASLSFPV